MRISVLLTTYNRTHDCIVCLDALLKQKRIDIEFILLDDFHEVNPTLVKYCEENDIKYIHTGAQKKGKVHWRVPGFAYNIGAKVAQGGYLIIGGAEMFHLDIYTLEQMYLTNEVSAPVIYDEPKSNLGRVENYSILNNKLPFCLGIPKEAYYYIGGYDEDFTGYCFDDNDFSDRVLNLMSFTEVDSEIIHLYNPRGAENRGDKRINNKAWNYNRALYLERKGSVIRNIDREWGKA